MLQIIEFSCTFVIATTYVARRGGNQNKFSVHKGILPCIIILEISTLRYVKVIVIQKPNALENTW